MKNTWAFSLFSCYWQAKRPNMLCVHVNCSVIIFLNVFMNQTMITFTVAWTTVIEGVQEARAVAGLRQLTFSGMSGARVMGMLHDAVVYLVEQLQGANRCQRHTFRFHKQASQEDDLPVNPSGCARSEVHLRSVHFFSSINQNK